MTLWVLVFAVLGFLAGVLFALWTDLGDRRADHTVRLMTEQIFEHAERQMEKSYRQQAGEVSAVVRRARRIDDRLGQ